MPPKAKFTKTEIIDAALSIVREKGFDALNARDIGSALGSSARPIFTVFKNMEEVQLAVKRSARDVYNSYVEKGFQKELAFKEVGIAYIRFAKEERRLFQLLFMGEQKRVSNLASVLSMIDDNYQEILQSILRDYGLNEEQAWKLYQHLWVYVHGIATLCATDVYEYSDDEIEESLKEVCLGVLGYLKGE